MASGLLLTRGALDHRQDSLFYDGDAGMNAFEQAEEKALRDYLHILDHEQWETQRKELGLPHPCDDCGENCKRCHIPHDYRR